MAKKMLAIPIGLKRWINPDLFKRNGEISGVWHLEIPEEWLVDAPVSAFGEWHAREYYSVHYNEIGEPGRRREGWNAAIDAVLRIPNVTTIGQIDLVNRETLNRIKDLKEN